MGIVFNSGSGGIICDQCHTLMASGHKKISIRVDNILVVTPEEGNKEYFCSLDCLKNHGSNNSSSVQILTGTDQPVDNPEYN